MTTTPDTQSPESQTPETQTQRHGLVTGGSGYIGSQLVPALLDQGWHVTVLSRSPESLPEEFRDRVTVVEGSATEADDLDRAFEGVEVAWYLIHSMDSEGDFRQRDRDLATTFAERAKAADLGRIIYLSGLHPEGELSEHLASRVEVGEILLASGVPTAVLQAGVVLGDGSASFDMLRHLTERLPIAFGPKWLKNKVQPIAVSDAVHYLVRAADLPASVNRTIDIAMDEALSYRAMMKRYAEVTGLMPRAIGTVPVLTPELASLWVGLVTPVDSDIARPLVGSLVHDAVKHEDDAATLLGDPPGGLLGFDEAIRRATAELDPHAWGRRARAVAIGAGAVALVGALVALGARRANSQ